MQQNRKYNIRGIQRDVQERETEAKKNLMLINKLSIQDLKSGGLDTIRGSYDACDINYKIILDEREEQED